MYNSIQSAMFSFKISSSRKNFKFSRFTDLFKQMYYPIQESNNKGINSVDELKKAHLFGDNSSFTQQHPHLSQNPSSLPSKHRAPASSFTQKLLLSQISSKFTNLRNV